MCGAVLSFKKVCKSCRSRQELSKILIKTCLLNYFLANIGVDTAENVPLMYKSVQYCRSRQELRQSPTILAQSEGLFSRCKQI